MDDDTSLWSPAEPSHFDVAADFSSLLDLDQLDLSFAPVDSVPGATDADVVCQQQHLLQLHQLHPLPHPPYNRATTALQDQHPQGVPGAASQNVAATQRTAAVLPAAAAATADGHFDFTFGGTAPQTSSMSQFVAPEFAAAFRGVPPPTPNSTEMHANPVHYLQQMETQAHALFDQRYQLHKEDPAAFTPLVSPAVTPHDAHFGYDFAAALPSAYFSPLTSPALKAQQKHLQQQTNAMLSHFHTPGSSASASPVDPDVDMLGDGTPASAPLEPSVKLRGKRPAPRTSRAATRVSQSPIAKPARRKQTLSATSLPKEVRDLVLERSQKTQTPRGQHIASALVPAPDGSEAESLSPEPLTEVMGPPPKPVSSTSQSPSIMPNSHASATSHTSAPAPFSDSSNLKDVCPATPASLMRLRQQPSSLTTHAEIPPLDDLSLPAPASTTPNDADDITPRIPARKTPKLGPLSTPGGPAALSAMPSPTLSALASPTSPGVPLTGNSSRKDTPLRTSRSSTAVPTKKRSSTGTAPNSTLVSPALRPRLSPHLQPSGTGNHSGTGSGGGAAALLASRSNYQNLVEGTTLPGISYPSSLSTNLTSKRASHKLAEQGRRDRINSALQELQAMLPASLSVSSPTTPTATAATAKDRDGAAASINNPQNSKATKVESAITYIKLLQQQCADQARLLDDRDRELAAVRAELAMLKHRE